MHSPRHESKGFDLATFPFEIADRHYKSRVAEVETRRYSDEGVFGHVKHAVRLAIGEAKVRGVDAAARQQVEQAMIDQKFAGLLDYQRDFSMDVADARMQNSIRKLKLTNRTMADFARNAILAEMEDTHTQEANIDMDASVGTLVARQFEEFDLRDIQI